MNKTFKLSVVGVALAAAALAGCTSTVSKGVNDNGQAQEIVFPQIDKASAIKEGIFPNIENLRKIAPGVTKDDLYYLIDRPHFSERLGAREWDYIFKFRETVGGPVTICQYKVIFDKDKKAQTFAWLPADCARFVNPTPAPVAAAPKTFTLRGDALFHFDRSGSNDLLPGGLAEVHKIAEMLKAEGADARITVIGHTDRLGSVAYNQRLSQRRAETIRAKLIEDGLNGNNITTRGAGASEPVVQCSGRVNATLKECLQPNRRVTIEVNGTKR